MHRPLLKSTRPLRFVSGLLSLALIQATAIPTFAQLPGYQPPSGGSPPTSSGIGGTRGGSCTGDTDQSFTILAPYSHIGQTAEPYPTFVWYVPDRQPLKIDFQLYRYDEDGQIQRPALYRAELDSQPGIMTFTLPPTAPELIVGKHYYWQVALICNPAHGSEDLIADAEIQVVDKRLPELERWYDLLKSTLDRKNSQSLSTLLSDLAALEQASAQTETDPTRSPDRSRELLQHGQQLIQIANHPLQPIAN